MVLENQEKRFFENMDHNYIHLYINLKIVKIPFICRLKEKIL